MRKGKVLVVDDDKDIRNLIHAALSSRGFDTLIASTGNEGIMLALAEQPDLILLDIEMPDKDGLEVCQEIRRRLYCPIVFLSVRGEETDVVLGLGVGADNYITKPFKVSELVARVEALIRRETLYAERKKQCQVLSLRDLTLDLSAFQVRKGGKNLQLTVTEFRLLQALVEHADQVLTRDQLLDHVWEVDADEVYTRTVDVHIGRLRKKIEDDPSSPRYILTVPGLGYKMPSDGV